MHSPLPPAPGPEAVYIFQQLDANVEAIVGAVVRLADECPKTVFLILQVDNDRLGTPLPGGYGATAGLLKELEKAGMARDRIELADFDHSGMIHTLVEAETVVRHAKSRAWRSLAVLAPSFHLPRAAMTTASVALREYPELRLYPVAGAAQPWQEEAAHSQGMLGVRVDFIDTEIERIVRYTGKGDIAPWDQLEKLFTASEVEVRAQPKS